MPRLQGYPMLAFLISASLFFAAPARAGQETVVFSTRDGCRIEAFYSTAPAGGHTFINVHGLGSNRHEWAAFQKELAARGQGWLSLDLRGHGGSAGCGSKPGDYRSFTREDWARASLDIEAAAGWLRKRGVPALKMVYCGASIGANLSVKAAFEGALKPGALVLLSPGLDYAGLRPEAALSEYHRYRVLFVAARDDAYAWNSAARLHAAAGTAELKAAGLDGGSGHGVDMFRSGAVAPRVIDWVKSGN